jgi:hypothetical protein
MRTTARRTIFPNRLDNRDRIIIILFSLAATLTIPFSTAAAQIFASSATETSVTLRWTAPGDDGYTGRASQYDIRYATSPISEANWGSATQVLNEPVPKTAGQIEVFTIQNLTPNFTYFFALKAADEALNWSPVSNSVTVILPPTALGSSIDSAGRSATLSCAQISSYFPLTYEIALDTSSSFSNPTIQAGVVSGPAVTAQFSGLEYNRTYYWRSRAIATDLSDSSDWSSTQTFSLSFNNPPGLPQHVSPANGDTVTADSLLLVVTNAIDPDGDPLTYDFWIGGDSAFTTVVDSAMNVTEGSSQTTATFSGASLQNGQKYWWRCRASDGTAQSGLTIPTWFVWASLATGNECETPPSIPALSSPANGTGVGTVTPTLCVVNSQPAPGCTQSQTYTFEVYSDSALTAPSVVTASVNEGGSTTCYTLTTSLSTGRYYWWRVRCYNGTSYSSWAGPFRFHTPNTPPNVPTPIAPPDGDTVSTQAPVLIVDSVSDADGTPVTCYFEVSTSATFSSLAAAGTVSGQSGQVSWQVSPALDKDSLYYWRVRVGDGIDYSGYSTVRSFTVRIDTNTAPTAPSILSPADSSTVDTLFPTLVVANGSDAEGNPLTYQFELYNETADTLLGGATDIVEGTTTTSWQIPFALADSTTYTWRARCFDGSVYSPWTSWARFTVLLSQQTNYPPTLPVHLSPANGSLVVTAPIELVIANSVDPEGDSIFYDFWIYSDSSLSQLVESRFDVPESPEQTSVILDFEPVNGQRYWWRVRAKDGFNTTSATAPTWFVYYNMSTGGDDYVPSPSSPADGAEVYTDRPTLTVNNIAAAGENYYYFEIARDSNFLSPVVSSPAVPEGDGGHTTWKVTEKLESDQKYYWRVRVNDYAYSQVASFRVKFRIYASPNPVRFRQGEYVTFHLPDEPVDLLIQTVSGETVLIANGISGEWYWYGTNEAGHNVAVGTYLWYVPNYRAKGKIVVKP